MKKGQLLSLDLLVSLIIITASTGILVHWTEEQSVLLKEKQSQAQLLQITELAANNLVADTALICQDTNAETGGLRAYMNNCVPVSGGTPLSKNSIGIPGGYGCMLQDSNNGNNNTTVCESFSQGTLANAKNYYSVTRQVVYYHGSYAGDPKKVSSTDIIWCKSHAASPECPLKPGTFTLYVWNPNE